MSAPSVKARETTPEQTPSMDKPASGSHVPQGEPGFLGRSIDAAMEVYSWMLALTHERLWYGVDFWWVSGHRKEGLLFGETLLLRNMCFQGKCGEDGVGCCQFSLICRLFACTWCLYFVRPEFRTCLESQTIAASGPDCFMLQGAFADTRDPNSRRCFAYELHPSLAICSASCCQRRSVKKFCASGSAVGVCGAAVT